ncbi:NAD(P)-binding domain-containing protein [Streptomyces sp. NPDC014892]|uniref:NAD(P)-binding domain-containing protein n=1 Tax=Streptomyces sp. NPDC014892 TaxID=3364930 RepID=UPI0037013521
MASVAEPAVEAVSRAAAVITMLPVGRQVLNLFNGVRLAVQPGTPFVDRFTVDVADTRRIHERGEDTGMRTLDAPVVDGVRAPSCHPHSAPCRHFQPGVNGGCVGLVGCG